MSETNSDIQVQSNGQIVSYEPEEKKPEVVSQESKVTTEGDNKSEPEGTEDKKPWEAKTKQETPHWAKKRFNEYSTSVRDLKGMVYELKRVNQELMEKLNPAPVEKKIDDYQSPQEFYKAQAEESARNVLKAEREKLEAEQAHKDLLRQLQESDRKNTEEAKKDLQDYDEVMKYADRDVTLPADVVKHLAISPAGAYVRYRIATDQELADQIKESSPAEKVELVSKLHDEILDALIKRRQTSSQDQAPNKPQPQANVQAQPKPQQQAKPAFKAPPKQNQGARVSMLEMDGDAYAKARLFG